MPTPTLPQVTVVGQLQPQLSQLDLLLQQSVGSGPKPRPPPTEFERLLQRPQLSEFDRLLQKEYAPRELKVEVVGKRARKFVRKLGRAARVSPVVGLALGIYDTLDFVYENYAKKKPRVDRPADRERARDPRGVQDRARPSLPTSVATLNPVDVLGTTLADLSGSSGLLGFYNPSKKNPFPKRKPGERYDYDPDTLTREQPRARQSPAKKPKTQPQLQPYDFRPRGDCITYRKKRPACPARGYKLKATAWRKVPCQ